LRARLRTDFAEQTRFFERHLKPWASRMFADLEMSRSANFYRAVGRVGRVFMELEAEPLRCPDDAEGSQRIDLEKMTWRRSQ